MTLYQSINHDTQHSLCVRVILGAHDDAYNITITTCSKKQDIIAVLSSAFIIINNITFYFSSDKTDRKTTYQICIFLQNII